MSLIEGNRCSLTAEQIALESRIFLTKSVYDDNNDQWSLLRQNFIPIDTNFYLLCSEDNFTAVRCLENGKFNVTIPIARACAKPLKEQIHVTPDSKCNSQDAQLYTVGYELGGHFLELYRSCYNKAKVRALYVIHEVQHFDVGKCDQSIYNVFF